MERFRAIRGGVSLVLSSGALLLSSLASAGDAIVGFSPAALSTAQVSTPQVSAPAGCVPAWLIDAAGIRRLPDRCPGSLLAQRTAGTPARGVTLSSSVAPAISVAASAEEAAKLDVCETLSFVDEAGVPRPRPDCVGGAAQSSAGKPGREAAARRVTAAKGVARRAARRASKRTARAD